MGERGDASTPGIACGSAQGQRLLVPVLVTKSGLLSHRTVPNEAGDHRATSELPLAEGGSLTPPSPTSYVHAPRPVPCPVRASSQLPPPHKKNA
jgi:hypothetical protein